MGIKKLGIVDLLKSGFFAWHSTSESAVDSICKNGFDPQRCSGQACGPGEYFGITSDVSFSYCRGGNFMLVAFILNGSHISNFPNFCNVIANPTDKSLAYCIPLLIINFGVKKTIGFDIGDTMVHRYVCYYWEQDGGKFEPYGQNSNDKLERQYMNYIQFEKKEFKNLSINLVRYNDDFPQSYTINFENMTQVNPDTGNPRRIERRAADLPIGIGNPWEFEISPGNWQRFDILWQGQLETNFKQYLNGIHHHCFQINLAPRPEIYEINFMNMTEKNTISGTIRNIRRK